ncbi:MAG TPA: 4-(cytidine 5'-diphospho)-2-C-methyl-D-erythritol kinase [Chitinophagaceae bacterium]|nr:4-(cytidine 5'-diphospho)-2-C-methyl-D-erythritol kinase [Chitinophagaceae bacterium]
MIVFPNCKINLGLHILQKRSDGYHDLETVFYPVPIADALEIIEYREPQRSSSLPFTLSGIAIEGDVATNLCMKAYRLLKRDYPELPHIQMHLHKVIPSGAGLGGGSADGSFTLTLLNRLFNLGISEELLIEYAAELGSDCPFFIINKPCLAQGKGEKLKRLNISLKDYKLAVINPGIYVNTGDAFRQLKPLSSRKPLEEIISKPVERWKDELINDFEKVIFPKHREIVDIKDNLYKQGAVYASMSGSGSTVFGLFPKETNIDFSFPPYYFTRELILN